MAGGLEWSVGSVAWSLRPLHRPLGRGRDPAGSSGHAHCMAGTADDERRAEERFARIAASRHNCVTLEEALAICGVSRSALSRRVDWGMYVRHFPGVYGVNGGEHGRRTELVAALLFAGDTAVADAFSAAALWSVPDAVVPDRPQIVVPGEQAHERLAAELLRKQQLRLHRLGSLVGRAGSVRVSGAPGRPCGHSTPSTDGRHRPRRWGPWATSWVQRFLVPRSGSRSPRSELTAHVVPQGGRMCEVDASGQGWTGAVRSAARRSSISRQRSSWSSSMYSSGWWATAMLPGPQTTAGMPAAW